MGTWNGCRLVAALDLGVCVSACCASCFQPPQSRYALRSIRLAPHQVFAEPHWSLLKKGRHYIFNTKTKKKKISSSSSS